MAERNQNNQEEPGTGLQRRLRRHLGFFDAMAVALGAIIGAGVFVTLGEAAAASGAGLLLAIPLAALVATFNALSSVELGVVFPRAGGGYEFGYRQITPLVGFLAGWVFLFAAITASATFALTFASYLRPLLPGISLRVLAVLLAGAAIAVNAFGAGVSARVNNLLVITKIGFLILFLVFGLPRFSAAHLLPLLPRGMSGLLHAAGLLFFAFTGYARPVTLVEEIREPHATLPRAVVAALSTATILYLVVAATALGSLGAAGIAQSPAPLRDALGAQGIGPTLLSLGAVVATVSVLLTELWGVSRLIFAMARRGDLPEFLARLAGPQRTPRNAVLGAGILILLLAVTVDLRALLSASSLALLFYYGIVNLSASRLDAGQRLYSPFVPFAGMASCLLLALSLPATAIATIFVVAVIGLGYYRWLLPPAPPR